MSYTITWEEAGVIWRYEGQLNGEELIQSNLDIYGDSRFDSLRYQIVDLQGVTDFAVKPQHMRKLAFLDRAAAQSNSHIRVAVVTNSDLGIEITQQYVKNTNESHWKTRVFDSYEEAINWARGYRH